MKFIDFVNREMPIKRELDIFFGDTPPRVIFDIGGCEGEDSIRYGRSFPDAEIFTFEPLKSNFDIIGSNLKTFGVDNVSSFNIALSDTDGEAEFFLSSGPKTEEWDYGNKSSSLLQPDREMHLETYNFLRFENSVSVPTRRLESFCREQGIEEIDLVHMDVQGAELMVLKGAGVFLDKIKMIWTEVESVALYRGQPLKRDVEDFMEKNGFVKVKDTVDRIDGDQLYVNGRYFPDAKPFATPGILYRALRKIYRGSLGILYDAKAFLNLNLRRSFSENGEDLVIEDILERSGVDKPRFIDIGAGRPLEKNNTALFYRKGSRGVNIEPDPDLFMELERSRKSDRNLRMAIGSEPGMVDFFLMTPPSCNTLSGERAGSSEREGAYLREVRKIYMETFGHVVKNYCGGVLPDFLNVNAGDMCGHILRSISGMAVKPHVVCLKRGGDVNPSTGLPESMGYLLHTKTPGYLIYVKNNPELN